PDIIVRNIPVNRPDKEFGQYSGTLNNVLLSDNVEHGNPNVLYVRVFNQSPILAYQSTVDIYWSRGSTLVMPKYWTQIGSIDIPVIPMNDMTMVYGPLVWNNVPEPGHYCFVGIIHNPFSPAPDLSKISSINSFWNFMSQNNNVVWRNFNVVDNIPNVNNEYNSYRFIARKPIYDIKERTRLEICCELPERAKAWLTGSIFNGKKRLDGNSCTLIPEFEHENMISEESELMINYFIPKNSIPGEYSIYARQLFDGNEVGRYTLHIKANL
ncbi:MAG: hypothetical protein OEX11_09020, partial [Nitrosomonas sp.]|nr:hypothetical protein [Nitrosomonas sp.]